MTHDKAQLIWLILRLAARLYLGHSTIHKELDSG
jgi:hypothetical protein